VEVLACGPDEALDTLCAWLRTGPPLADVTEILIRPVDYRELPDFRTG